MLEPRYSPQQFEARIYEKEHSRGAFQPNSDGSGVFCTMMPPPNVTGALHMGHALNMTLQDILVRYHRMLGKKNALATRHRPCRHRNPSFGRKKSRNKRHRYTKTQPHRPG